MGPVTPPKNPRFRPLRWEAVAAERERKVRDFVDRSLYLPFFWRIQRETRIPSKQLARTLSPLRKDGYEPMLRWIDCAVRRRFEARSATARDIGPLGLPSGSGGRLWAIDLLGLQEWPLSRTEILDRYRSDRRTAAGRNLGTLLREGVLEKKPIRNGTRGRPRVGTAPRGPRHRSKQVRRLEKRR